SGAPAYLGDCWPGRARRSANRADLQSARLGIHAAAQRRRHSLHAGDDAGHFGNADWAETATDPAPFSMMETVVVLKPESEWPKVPRWYSSRAPDWMQKILRKAWPDHKSYEELIYGPGGLNEALGLPGVSNAWTMPIKARVDMLTTGVRTPIGIKIMGANLDEVQ